MDPIKSSSSIRRPCKTSWKELILRHAVHTSEMEPFQYGDVRRGKKRYQRIKGACPRTRPPTRSRGMSRPVKERASRAGARRCPLAQEEQGRVGGETAASFSNGLARELEAEAHEGSKRRGDGEGDGNLVSRSPEEACSC
ncbi:hypothetical protein K437DRAFT_150212 [Tilletiaria anomala UBC 951]|uniref:Uncharacterized protein n=1 Tax=Tilletiaria anomala (strain ATCC 24038 / CBS 436.72 / UBC 951) TaxID=1037660 RepID=A0A066WGH8_TILAU|nr:uncharacterized protein K437DRAFT_150212 [Tilletiaria anomala UBC 951]KDN52866.1 hypothetical protein K437DRAFT_150212 [Tilletiaria anomala UBC 951]